MTEQENLGTFLGTPRVLFADESDQTLDIFKYVMARYEWEGLYVKSAVEIIETVNDLFNRGVELDGIVTDVTFISGTSSVTGITAAREIRKAMPNVPIIFLTAYSVSIIREEIRRVGAELITKPFDVENLFTRLENLIYWYRVARVQYTGVEKRKNSLNRTPFTRRATDHLLSTPDRILAAHGAEDK